MGRGVGDKKRERWRSNGGREGGRKGGRKGGKREAFPLTTGDRWEGGSEGWGGE